MDTLGVILRLPFTLIRIALWMLVGFLFFCFLAVILPFFGNMMMLSNTAWVSMIGNGAVSFAEWLKIQPGFDVIFLHKFDVNGVIKAGEDLVDVLRRGWPTFLMLFLFGYVSYILWSIAYKGEAPESASNMWGILFKTGSVFALIGLILAVWETGKENTGTNLMYLVGLVAFFLIIYSKRREFAGLISIPGLIILVIGVGVMVYGVATGNAVNDMQVTLPTAKFSAWAVAFYQGLPTTFRMIFNWILTLCIAMWGMGITAGKRHSKAKEA